MITFTGTRAGMTVEQLDGVKRLLKLANGDCHHGGCEGADRQFHIIAYNLARKIIIHPGDKSQADFFRGIRGGVEVMMKIKPYLVRNREMVDLASVVIGAPSCYYNKLRSGTWSTIRYAVDQNKLIFVILPDGRVCEPREDSFTFLFTKCH